MDGTILGDRYLLAEELGSGGTGAVYRATDLRTGGPVAVKVPHAFLAHDPSFRERLRREARLAAALTSPRVVRMVDLDEHEGVPYLVMEYVAGETLAERLRREGPFPLAEALAVTREVARALEAAHALGVVHRDLTPRNVKLVDGQVKVLDFGIGLEAGLSEVTPPGGFFSAPAYSAPERLSGAAGEDDPRADLYSAGAILYTLLTGRPPAPAAGAPAQGHTGQGPATDLTGLPPAAARILARCLAPDPARRYGSAAELSAALGTVLAALGVRPTVSHATPTTTPALLTEGASGAPPPAAPSAEAPGARTRILPITSTPAQPTAGVPVPHNLPAALTTFVGREGEVGDLVRLLRGSASGAAGEGGVGGGAVAERGGSSGARGAGEGWSSPRLVTIAGAGGAGKTRLALQVAARLAGQGGRGGPERGPGTPDGAPYPDGVWLVPLASLADGQLVVEAVAGALGVRIAPGGPALDAVTAWLRQRRLLLVLDNCEHLVGACAAFAEGALLAAPGLRVLATSREPLGISGEVLWRLPTLPAPDLQALPPAERLLDFAAVRLFVERARGVSPGFSLTPENSAAVARICQRLDGLPLAIELAAARTRVLSVEQIAARLDDRFRLLTAGNRTAPPQQQTLRASMDWSHDLLSEPEQTLFARLSVFAGGFSLEAAEQVCAVAGDPVLDAADVLDLLTQLVDKSLVVALYGAEDGSAADGPAETRYRLPETVREYGAERLAGRGEAAVIRQAHTRHFAALAEAAGPALSGPQQRSWLDLLEREHDNLRAALRAALDGDDPATALRMGYGLWKFWAVRSHHAEGRRWLEEALSAAEALSRDASGLNALARGNSAAGSLARGRRDYAAARAYQEKALSLWRELGDRRGVAAALGALGGLASDQGDDEGARPLYEESLALRREVGDAGGVALMQTSLGNLAYHRRELPAARDAYREALSRYQELGDAGGEALLRISLGHVLRALGDVPGAVAQGVAGLDGFRALGDRWGTSLALGLMGRLALDQGDPAAAEAYLAECAAILRALEDRWNLAVALLSQARAALALGDPQRAAALNREGLQLALAGRLQRHLAAGLEATAGLVLHDFSRPTSEVPRPDPLRAERLEQSVRLLGAAVALREGAGSSVLPADQAAYAALVDAYRDRLGSEAFDAALSAGRDLSMEDAVALAGSLLPLPVLGPGT